MLARIACPCQILVAGTAGDDRRSTARWVSSPAVPSQARCTRQRGPGRRMTGTPVHGGCTAVSRPVTCPPAQRTFGRWPARQGQVAIGDSPAANAGEHPDAGGVEPGQ